MPSDRLRAIYNIAEWRGPVREAVLARAGGRCQYAGCGVLDRRYGGTQSLHIHHTTTWADPLDITYLKALCRKHHGHVDGGRAGGGGRM